MEGVDTPGPVGLPCAVDLVERHALGLPLDRTLDDGADVVGDPARHPLDGKLGMSAEAKLATVMGGRRGGLGALPGCPRRPLQFGHGHRRRPLGPVGLVLGRGELDQGPELVPTQRPRRQGLGL